MSDMGDHFRELKEDRKILRQRYGVSCVGCQEKFPKANPSILLPQQRCRTCGYVDPRPKLMVML